MAFSADELRVLRRALANALHPAPLPDDDVQDCLRLAGSVDEVVGEAGRLRAFLLADLARYRDALPGSATGYLELLQDALAAGYDPRPEDLAALRLQRCRPVAAALLERCQVLAERSVRARLMRPGRTRDGPRPAQQAAGPARRPGSGRRTRTAEDPVGPTPSGVTARTPRAEALGGLPAPPPGPASTPPAKQRAAG